MVLTSEHTVLLVEDDAPQRKTLKGFLERRGYTVLEADSAKTAVSLGRDAPVDLLLTDLRLGGPDGIELLSALREHSPDLQGIVLTAYGTVDDAVRAMRAGAYDFVSKPVDLARLEALIEKALEKASLSRENRGLREVVKSSGAFRGIIGVSPAIQRITELAAKVAPSRASVLILGESGTGKEVLARAIHLASPRARKPFITVNCAALPETLIESELFGHEQGAFTGAIAKKKGRFELADGGTLFLDEVGEIPLHVQVKLLNVLQSNQFERVGGQETLRSDVRIVAATNRDIGQQVADGTFREDLYYRLNVVTFTIPPLRERREDISLLAYHFLEKQADLTGTPVCRIDAEALELLETYPFPGNVRELENWIERAVVFAEGDALTKEDLPEPLFVKNLKTNTGVPLVEEGLEAQVASLEISLIQTALKNAGGNQSAAARTLKITERNIRYKMKKYGL
jgi:DNA-binding NtrC family response regulator